MQKMYELYNLIHKTLIQIVNLWELEISVSAESHFSMILYPEKSSVIHYTAHKPTLAP